jgi:hypothetical protein
MQNNKPAESLEKLIEDAQKGNNIINHTYTQLPSGSYATKMMPKMLSRKVLSGFGIISKYSIRV